MQDLFILTYHGEHMIKAIKALRAVLGVSLKDGKDILKQNAPFEHGILVSKIQTYAINGVYTEAFLFSDTLTSDRFHDFLFERQAPVLYRDDFSMHTIPPVIVIPDEDDVDEADVEEKTPFYGEYRNG